MNKMVGKWTPVVIGFAFALGFIIVGGFICSMVWVP